MKNAAAGRRGFFRSFAREAFVQIEEARGNPHYRLADLGGLELEDLSAIVPAILPGVQIVPSEHDVQARLTPGGPLTRLFRKSDAGLFVFNGINGRNTLGKIAHELAGQDPRKLSDAWSFTRSFFLRLVELRVCAPANASSL